MTSLNKITSLDFIKNSLYDSNFSGWLENNLLTSLISKDSWKLRTVDGNIFFDLNISNNFSFIRTKFNVGIIHIANERDLDHVVEKIMEYGEKPNLIANLFSDTVNSGGFIFLQLTYEANIYEGMDIISFLNTMFDQINNIKQDVKYMLDLKIVSPNDIDKIDDNTSNNQHTHEEDNDNDNDEEEEEKEEDDEPLNPYDSRGNK